LRCELFKEGSDIKTGDTMLKGKIINLKLLEKDDIPLFTEWANDADYGGKFEPLDQCSLNDMQKWYENLPSTEQWFFIEKKDGTKVGHILYLKERDHYTIGFILHLEERGKGYCTEAVKILVDYLFLSKDIVRVQAEANPGNTASCRVLEKAGFIREGVLRQVCFIRGKWLDGALYSILREEWETPKILT
jgi:RimJ/RimL family protein N-acetyltransferase